MDFSFVFKTIFISFFIFILIYVINFASTQKDLVTSNNFGVKNATKEALNLGVLRTEDVVSYDNEILLESTIKNYLANNNLSVDDVNFDIAINNNIVTVKIGTSKNLFDNTSNSYGIFSYVIERSE